MTYRRRHYEVVDSVLLTAPAGSLSLSGLSSETDGVYMLEGRISSGAAADAYELRPDGVIQTGIASDWNESTNLAVGSSFSSVSGWVFGGSFGGGRSFVTGWIWPSGARGGGITAGGPRMYRMVGTRDSGAGVAGVFSQAAWGDWEDAAVASWSSLDLVPFVGPLLAGTEVIIYKMVYD